MSIVRTPWDWEGIGKGLSLVPRQQSPERAVQQRKAMSKEGYNGRLQGAPGVALSCPALLSPGINIHCAAAPPSSASQENLSCPCPTAPVLSWSHCQAALLSTGSAPQESFPGRFDPAVCQWWPGKGWAVPQGARGLGELKVHSAQEYPKPAGGTREPLIPNHFSCWHPFFLLGMMMAVGSSEAWARPGESDIIPLLLCPGPCLNWETKLSSLCLLLEAFLSRWGSGTFSSQPRHSRGFCLFPSLSL